ncbi:hypothetical protein [Flavobacterium poyangense]|uniref:hypothetical protein n=1 Tax=Flavobacterium poyangense TaxID=2204302 RepID=UPI001420B301|nr:hypothetical protein [Flavobacterium sp. JXAS1]
MKQFKIILFAIPFFMLSCTTSKYLKNYEPVRVFLRQENIDPSKNYILQEEKVDYKKVLSEFKEYKSASPYFDVDFKPIVLQNDIAYKKAYDKYINNTLKRYWKKEDFSEFNFVLKKQQAIKNDSINEYSRSQLWIYISEPMYYYNREYLIFTYDIYGRDGGMAKLVFMKKEKGKWTIDRISSSDVFF